MEFFLTLIRNSAFLLTMLLTLGPQLFAQQISYIGELHRPYRQISVSDAGELLKKAVSGQPLIVNGKTYDLSEVNSILRRVQKLDNQKQRDQAWNATREYLQIPALVQDVVALQNQRGHKFFPAQIDALTRLFDQVVSQTIFEKKAPMRHDISMDRGLGFSQIVESVIGLNHQFRNHPEQLENLSLDIIVALNARYPEAVETLRKTVVESLEQPNWTKGLSEGFVKQDLLEAGRLRMRNRIVGFFTHMALGATVLVWLNQTNPEWIQSINLAFAAQEISIKLTNNSVAVMSFILAGNLIERIEKLILQFQLKARNLIDLHLDRHYGRDHNSMSRASPFSCRKAYAH